MAADQLASTAAEHGLGLRHGTDRRRHDRRDTARGTADRRHRDRRLATLRSLLFSALAFTVPRPAAQAVPPVKLPRVLASRSGPRVTSSIMSFELLDPRHAYDDLIREAAVKYHLEPALIRSVIRMESGFDPGAISRVGAIGLMQLMPDVAVELGVLDPFDPRENIMGGAQKLRNLLDAHHGDLALTLASYNAGPGAVAKHGNKVPPFPETQNYVKRITNWIADERAATE
jgi:hypothetical protein